MSQEPLPPCPPEVHALQAEAVDRGALFLDDRIPGWFDQIDLDRLRLMNGERCILGQIGLCVINEASYEDMLAHLGLYDRPQSPIKFGFYASRYGMVDGCYISMDDRWQVLDKLWHVAILDRRAVAEVTR